MAGETARGVSGQVLSRPDDFQRRHGWVSFPLAVISKFADDQGGYLRR